MSEEKIIGSIVKGHCPTCGENKKADVVGYHCSKWEDDEHPIWGKVDRYILECRGCESVYYKTVEVFSEDIDYIQNRQTGEWEGHLEEDISYWPAPSKRPIPSWHWELKMVDYSLGGLFDDVYKALNNDLPILAAIAIRTTFDRASELLGVDTNLSFAKKLVELKKMGKIGDDEETFLDILTDAGSAAAHRGWKPSVKELETMTSIIEGFLYRIFILKNAVGNLKDSVPQRK